MVLLRTVGRRGAVVGWWLPVGWELFGFELVVDPGAPGLVLFCLPLSRMRNRCDWLRHLRSAITLRAWLTRRVSALTGRCSRRLLLARATRLACSVEWLRVVAVGARQAGRSCGNRS